MFLAKLQTAIAAIDSDIGTTQSMRSMRTFNLPMVYYRAMYETFSTTVVQK